jgi:hypothetical protein
VTLAILPEAPLAGTPLVVALRGASADGISWLKNGEPIAGASGENLDVGSFVKGDSVTVVVESKSGEHRATVTIGNTPPRIKQVKFRDAAIRAGQPIELLVEAEDLDDDPVTLAYRWTTAEDGSVIGEDAILPAAKVLRGSRIGFMVTPSDGEIEGEPFQGSAIEVPNAPPVITSQPPLEFKSTVYRYDVKATDADGDPVSYALDAPPSGMTIESATGLLTWPVAGVAAGEYQINIVVEDSAGAKAFQDYRLTLGPPQETKEPSP